jgi:hypothetical protein
MAAPDVAGDFRSRQIPPQWRVQKSKAGEVAAAAFYHARDEHSLARYNTGDERIGPFSLALQKCVAKPHCSHTHW